MLETTPLHLTQPGLVFSLNSLGAVAFSCLKIGRLMPFSPAFPICYKGIAVGYSSTKQRQN